MASMAGLRLEVTSAYVCDVSSLFTRPDDSSQLCYIQESASFCLLREEKQKQEGEKRDAACQ